jgi:ligand-binding SRPBCC domain-containing protein
MHLYYETVVARSPAEVWRGFTRDLFVALNPPWVPMQLLRFDGCQVDDEVHVQLRLLGVKLRWVSRITAAGEDGGSYHFVDEGVQLPPMFQSWRHRHGIEAHPNGTRIIDDIRFTSPLPGLAAALYPGLALQFRYRRPIYRKFFS